MFRKDLQLTDLVNLEDWQKIQDSFSEVLEVTLRTFSLNGAPISKTSRPSRLCSEVLPGMCDFEKICQNCAVKEGSGWAVPVKKGTYVKCPFGLDFFVVPITAMSDMVVACIIAGPLILKSRKAVSEYTKDAEKFGIKLEALMDALIEINVFSYNKVYSMTSLIKDIFSYMAQTGYHKKRLGEITPEVAEIDPLFSKYYEEKVLSSLLNSCALALNADSGSVMTIDKNTNMLNIKVASKLDDKVLHDTHIKMGEGIAGLAAQTAQPIILPKDENRKELSGKMNRKYIKSSMIIPFNKGNSRDSKDVYGVINLNIVRRDADFSEKDIAIVKELINLASIALIPIRQPETK